MKIAIIVGSIREGRFGSQVGAWVAKHASQHATADEVTYDLLELADFDVPLLTSPTVPGAAKRDYDDDRVTRWGETVDAYDAFVFVTPEYNHGVPGAFKNAFDSIYPEWSHKAVAFVAYGADGGVRAVEHWRPVVANAMMVDVRAQVSLSMFLDAEDGDFTPAERRTAELDTLLDQLVAMARACSQLRV